MDSQEKKIDDSSNKSARVAFKTQIARLKLSYVGHIMQRPRSLKRGSNAEKKEKKRIANSKADGLFYSSISAMLENLDHHGQNLCGCQESKIMEHDLSIGDIEGRENRVERNIYP